MMVVYSQAGKLLQNKWKKNRQTIEIILKYSQINQNPHNCELNQSKKFANGIPYSKRRKQLQHSMESFDIAIKIHLRITLLLVQ